MKKLTTLQQTKCIHGIQILIILWCIKTFIVHISIFTSWFSIFSLSVLTWTLIQLCCRLIEVYKIEDWEK